MTEQKPLTRIQQRNRTAILDAALEVFSRHGFRGATLDQIAREAGLSKPNVLYYFKSKEAIHSALLNGLMDVWVAPLRALDPTGDPVEELLEYVRKKLALSRQNPRESRLFANEIVQGAPHIAADISGPVKTLVDEKAATIAHWVHTGALPPLDPHHLLFSIWATTQHYADFDCQVRGILDVSGQDHFVDAEAFLIDFYTRALTCP
ncbi:MAG: TetR family transcriptional regulator [Rhodobacterales bacterium]|nr:MAG: TetR family transcriptional regulator [Rhodobacterales bacterium]